MPKKEECELISFCNIYPHCPHGTRRLCYHYRQFVKLIKEERSNG